MSRDTRIPWHELLGKALTDAPYGAWALEELNRLSTAALGVEASGC
ncbi:hypothetical protein Thiowin_00139 [Thiorhodovibrio winogradskyi]|uniref:Uncharacterized protein n=1 Tax=Thiorhodovibrio winogradskyi TaxID=77007 RepID=A0ABZ0S4G2_9GAMM